MATAQRSPTRSFRRGIRAIAVVALLAPTTTATALEIAAATGGDPAVTTIAVSGLLEAGDVLKVRGFYGRLDTAKPIVAQLTINGGSYAEARLIGRFFHQVKVRTEVAARPGGTGPSCVGVCFLVLLGGRDPVTEQPSQVKYSTGRIAFTGTKLTYADREYTAKDVDASVAGTQKLFMETANYLAAVGARPQALQHFFAVLPNSAGQVKELSDSDALDLGISVYDERTQQLIKPLPMRR